MPLQPFLNRAGALVSVGVDFGLVVFMPAIVPFVVFHVAVRVLPLWGQALVSVVLFALLLVAIWYLTGDRVNKMIRAHHETRLLIWFPLAASLGMLVCAMHVFSSISAVLVALGVSEISPSVPQQFWDHLTNLYLWHFLASVPSFKNPRHFEVARTVSILRPSYWCSDTSLPTSRYCPSHKGLRHMGQGTKGAVFCNTSDWHLTNKD